MLAAGLAWWRMPMAGHDAGVPSTPTTAAAADRSSAATSPVTSDGNAPPERIATAVDRYIADHDPVPSPVRQALAPVDGEPSPSSAPTLPAAFGTALAIDAAATSVGDARSVGPTVAAAIDSWRAAQTASAAAASGVAASAAADATPDAAARSAATAVAAFERFALAVPALADRAALGRGAALGDAGDAAGAAAAYATAAALAGDPATAVLAHIRVGNARLAEGDPVAAAIAYAAAVDAAPDDGSRAQALAGLVASQVDAGYVDAAMAARLRLVRELPASAPAAVALERLREAGVPVPVREEAALHRAQGDAARADALLAAAGIAPPPDEAAWLEARDIERTGRDAEAMAAYAAFVERHGASSRVAEALWRRAWLALAPADDPTGDGGHDSAGPHIDAAITSLDALARRRPDDPRAGEARVLAGVLAWQAGRTDEAVARWTEAAAQGERAGHGADAARAHLWLAKTANDTASKRAHAAAAIASDPLGDAAARAVEWAEGATEQRVGGASGAGRSDVAPYIAPYIAPEAAPDVDADDAAVIAWLSRWTVGADAAAWAAAREAAAHRPAVVRGAAWLALGERRQALAAWRAGVRDAPAPGDRLAAARLARELGLWTIAGTAAERVLAQAPAANRADTPAAVLRLAYPLAWPDLVAAAAAEHAVPPALLAALVWQESRWDPAAVSSAGARGLTQVMPATGHGVAGALGVPGFSVDQLEDPATSLRFGAQYLGVQMKRFDGRDAVALAAYNAGPGNAAVWWAAAGGDEDVFMARIAFPETRRYVRAVIGAEGVYRRLAQERGR